MSSVNSFTIGDGTAGTKSYLVNDEQSTSPGLRYQNSLGYWTMSTDGITFDAVGLASGNVIGGQNNFRVGDNSNTGNKRLQFNVGGSSDPEIRFNVSTSQIEVSEDGSNFGDAITENTAVALVSGQVLIANNSGQVEGYQLGNGQLLIGNSSSKPSTATLTAGTGITITPGPGAITVSTSAGLSTKSGAFTRDISIASGTQAVTGVGFQPKAVVFFATLSGSANYFSVGMDDGTTGKTIYWNNGSVADSWSADSNSESIRMAPAAGTDYRGHITTLGSDGFTITWTKTGSPTGTIDVYYLALS